MNEREKETLRVRLISVAFVCLALAIFQPMGLAELGSMVYVHLLAILMLGVVMCYVTEALMSYVVRMPATLDNGVNYIIKRNLRFQLINTPLEALLICTYFHYPMSAIGAPDPLSPMGFLKTLLLLAFCSFAIGLYWRYKFRSRYLALELEETKRLNEQLHTMQQQAELRAKAAEAAKTAGENKKKAQKQKESPFDYPRNFPCEPDYYLVYCFLLVISYLKIPGTVIKTVPGIFNAAKKGC